jgi:CO/xanthine dehydrogenase FAD-binding subunit
VATVSGYSRPASLEEALSLLAEPGTVPIGGGTTVVPFPAPAPITVIDLQALGLDGIVPTGSGCVRIGATATLQELADCADLPPVVREAARRERSSALRAQATVGGTVVTAQPESELLATLLVHRATVSLAGADGTEEHGLASLLARLPLAPGTIVTAVTLDSSGRSAVARTGRTRADRPIVAAAARVDGAGDRLLALSGVAATPVLVDEVDDLEPPSDFRGSARYRLELARILAARALEALR